MKSNPDVEQALREHFARRAEAVTEMLRDQPIASLRGLVERDDVSVVSVRSLTTARSSRRALWMRAAGVAASIGLLVVALGLRRPETSESPTSSDRAEMPHYVLSPLPPNFSIVGASDVSYRAVPAQRSFVFRPAGDGPGSRSLAVIVRKGMSVERSGQGTAIGRYLEAWFRGLDDKQLVDAVASISFARPSDALADVTVSNLPSGFELVADSAPSPLAPLATVGVTYANDSSPNQTISIGSSSVGGHNPVELYAALTGGDFRRAQIGGRTGFVVTGPSTGEQRFVFLDHGRYLVVVTMMGTDLSLAGAAGLAVNASQADWATTLRDVGAVAESVDLGQCTSTATNTSQPLVLSCTKG
jgi:hypothetical protein